MACFRLVPSVPDGVAEAKPMETSFALAPTVETDVPVAVVADGTVEVKFVLDVLHATAVAVYKGFRIARHIAGLQLWLCWRGTTGQMGAYGTGG